MSTHETLLCDDNKDKRKKNQKSPTKLRWRDETVPPLSSSSSRRIDDAMESLEYVMTSEEECNTWYQSHELMAQGLLARHIAAGIRKDEPISDESSYIGVLERVYNSCLLECTSGPSNEDLTRLEHWTRVAHSRRGLERLSIPVAGHQRIQTRKASVKDIVKFQHSVGPHFDPDQKAEMIRMRSLTWSHVSRRYAAIMGHADAVAVQSDPSRRIQLRCYSI